MKVKIIWTKKALRVWERLDKKRQQRIESDLVRLGEYLAGVSSKPPDIKRLKGILKGFYRLRVGSWRIILAIEPMGNILTIVVMNLTSRGNAY